MATATIAERTAQAVSQVMVNAGFSRLKLAEATGIPYTTLKRKLLGVTPFDVREVYLIARALSVPAADLLPDEFHAARISA